MTYPVQRSQALPVGQALTLPFLPQKAGLVKAIVSAAWDPTAMPPPDSQRPPGEGEPTVFPMAVRLDIFKPTSPTPLATQSAQKKVGNDPKHDLGKPAVTLWADAPAGPDDVPLGEPSAALAFLPVDLHGDGRTQIVQLRDGDGRLGMVVYAPQPGGGHAASWSTPNLGQGAGAIRFMPVTANGDGRTHILQWWNNGGRLGLVVYSPQTDGSYAAAFGTGDVGAAADAIGFVPVSMKGDGRMQVVQLTNVGTRLQFTVHTPRADGSWQATWTGPSGQGAGALAFLPVTMHGDGKTQIVQLWDNGGRLSFITYAPQADGRYALVAGQPDVGQDAAALAFLPVTMHGDGKTQIVQLWDSGGRLGITVYAPQADGSWTRAWTMPNIGEGAGALGFFPVAIQGDGRTHIVQPWDNGGRLGLIVYAPQADGSYAVAWGTGDAGQASDALCFLPTVPGTDRHAHLLQLRDEGGSLSMTDHAPQPDASYAVAWTSDKAPWTARITNTGEVPVNCEVTVRYQTVDGPLGKVDHIVVLMLENRSFDHMLGHLSLEQGRADVNGLKAGMSNPDADGTPQPIHHRTDTWFRNDLGHGEPDVAEQLALGGANQGFVRNFAKVLMKAADDLPPTTSVVSDQALLGGGDSQGLAFRPVAPGPVTVRCVPDRVIRSSESGKLGSVALQRPGKPAVTQVFAIGAPAMGLQYTATADDLATPGDWTCTVFNGTETAATFSTTVTYVQQPHDTSLQEPAHAAMAYYGAAELPAYDLLAREYAVCDRWFAALPTDTWPNRLYALSGGCEHTYTTPSTDEVLKHPPAFQNQTVFEAMEAHGQDWKIFFHDIPFALVYARLAQDARYTRRMRTFSNGDGGDLQHAIESGNLPAFSWIDPNFSDLREDAAAASDDHPPGDVTHGQRLVSRLYSMLSSSPAWSKTMFIITYDEHGGFFDHVTPPALGAADAPQDDDPAGRRYGLRVPALVVSPWVPRGAVSSTTFDHTSVLNTVLRRFCPDALTGMGVRVATANDLGGLLSREAPRPDVPPMPTIAPPASPTPAVRLPDAFGRTLRAAVLGF